MVTETEEKIIEGIRALWKLQNQQLQELQKIKAILLLSAEAPALEAPIEAFKTYNWGEIGASVETTDAYGVAVVRWGGRYFKRRSPENKLGVAIWFSRSLGGEDGKTRYERLITFKPLELPEPVSRAAEKYCK